MFVDDVASKLLGGDTAATLRILALYPIGTQAATVAYLADLDETRVQSVLDRLVDAGFITPGAEGWRLDTGCPRWAALAALLDYRSNLISQFKQIVEQLAGTGIYAFLYGPTTGPTARFDTTVGPVFIVTAGASMSLQSAADELVAALSSPVDAQLIGIRPVEELRAVMTRTLPEIRDWLRAQDLLVNSKAAARIIPVSTALHSSSADADTRPSDARPAMSRSGATEPAVVLLGDPIVAVIRALRTDRATTGRTIARRADLTIAEARPILDQLRDQGLVEMRLAGRSTGYAPVVSDPAWRALNALVAPR